MPGLVASGCDGGGEGQREVDTQTMLLLHADGSKHWVLLH